MAYSLYLLISKCKNIKAEQATNTPIINIIQKTHNQPQ